MPRKTTSKSKPLLSRDEVVGLCQRWLKPDVFDFKRDAMVVYRLLKKYPSYEFWMAYTLPFQLNCTRWFLTKDGKEQLERDWNTYLLDIPAQPEYKLEDAKVGPDVVVNKKPKTVAELLK